MRHRGLWQNTHSTTSSGVLFESLRSGLLWYGAWPIFHRDEAWLVPGLAGLRSLGLRTDGSPELLERLGPESTPQPTGAALRGGGRRRLLSAVCCLLSAVCCLLMSGRQGAVTGAGAAALNRDWPGQSDGRLPCNMAWMVWCSRALYSLID